MNPINGNRLRSLCMLVLSLLCLGVATSQAYAQCCCGGVHLSLHGKNKKPIAPMVTAVIGLGKDGETMLPRLIEPREELKGHRTIRVSADCYGFSLMEITVVHKGQRMVLRLRDLPSGELGDIYLEPFAFRSGIFQIDFKGELERPCKRTKVDFQCVIPSVLWQKIIETKTAKGKGED